jgi:hypothetical protein
MRPEAQPASKNTIPIETMRRMIANPLNFPATSLSESMLFAPKNSAQKKGAPPAGTPFPKKPQAIRPG